ncbi:aminotransferase class III-fold pyridoxal phosphate-dependent enzyme, partial [Streptococcus pyogenes]
ILPDIVTLAKGLANGLPAGAILGKSQFGSVFHYGSHGSTFGGNKLAMAAASATLDSLLTNRFLDDVEEKGRFLFKSLKNE